MADEIMERLAFGRPISTLDVGPEKAKQFWRHMSSELASIRSATRAERISLLRALPPSIHPSRPSAWKNDSKPKSAPTRMTSPPLEDHPYLTDDRVLSPPEIDVVSTGLGLDNMIWPMVPLMPPLARSPEDRNYQLILHNVRFYTSLRVEQGGGDTTTDDLMSKGSSPVARAFWPRLKTAIYLLKTAHEFPRCNEPIPRLIGEAVALIPDMLESGSSLQFIQEILITLSPTNTKVCSSLRHELLCKMSQAASCSKNLGDFHPIKHIIEALRKDARQPMLSSIALNALLEAIGESVNVHHPAFEMVTNTMITCTRRSGDLRSAKEMAEAARIAAENRHGATSDQARRATLQAALIYAKLGDHDHALPLRYRIIQESTIPFTSTIPSDQRQLKLFDAISINAMKGIAEYHSDFDDTEGCVEWLKIVVNAEDDLWHLATPDIRRRLNNIHTEDLY